MIARVPFSALAAPLLLLVTASASESDDLVAAQRAQQQLREASARAKKPFVFIGGGSGVCISEDGYILTNNHVVARNDRWMVRVYGAGCLALANVVGRDPQGDVALLKIEKARDLPFARFADLNAVRPGQRVLALGDPYKLGDMDGAPSVSCGTLCAKHRYLGDPENPSVRVFYADALQTDAAVNPGSSGGPLFTLNGELLGLTGQIMARYGGKTNSGVAYAVPADQIARFLPILKSARGGSVFHGDLPAGLRFELDGEEVLPEHAAAAGAQVKSVARGSAAWEAGLREGDRVLKADGVSVCGAYRLLGMVQSRPEGVDLEIEVMRDGRRIVWSIKLPRFDLAERPNNPAEASETSLQEDARERKKNVEDRR